MKGIYGIHVEIVCVRIGGDNGEDIKPLYGSK